MPNYCGNVVTFRHANPSVIEKIAAAANTGLFQAFCACPEELYNQEFAGMPADAINILKEENRREYGAADWYAWCIKHWGTKWDVNQDEVDIEYVDSGSIKMMFQTAWSPPIGFYEHIHNTLGVDVEATYFEPGMMFCGSYTSSLDSPVRNIDLSRLEGLTEEELLEAIPDEIETDHSVIDTVFLNQGE